MAGYTDKVSSDDKYQIRNNSFVRKGYDFICWNTKADGTGTDIYENLLTSFLQDITLYAKWQINYGFIDMLTSGNVVRTNNNNVVSIPLNKISELRTANTINLTNSNIVTIILKLNISNIESYSSDVIGYSVLGFRDLNYLSDNADKDFELYINANKLLVFKLTNTVSVFLIVDKQDLYIKFVKNCSNYDISVSDDGITYKTFIHVSSPLEFYNKYLYIGTGYSFTTISQSTIRGTEILLRVEDTKEWVATCGVDVGKPKSKWKHIGVSGHGYYNITYKNISYSPPRYNYITTTQNTTTVMNNLECSLDTVRSYVNTNNIDYQMRLI